MYGLIERFARAFAWLGGIVLCALVLLVCLSVLGRSLNGFLYSDFMQHFAPLVSERLLQAGIGPINGDFELVEAGMAFAIFAFLPLCQLNGAHASVDIAARRLPLPLYRALRAVVEVLFAATLVLIAVQLASGMASKYASGQTTLLLQFPLWWSYCASLSGAIAAALVAVFVASCRVYEMLCGESIMPASVEAGR